MFNRRSYDQTKALIGFLEDRKERLEKEDVSMEEASQWSFEIEACWKLLCRRNQRRGPYDIKRKAA